MLLVLVGELFAKEVKLSDGSTATFRVQLPPGVSYSVRCDACSYEEKWAEGVRYLDFVVSRSDRVEVEFPTPSYTGRVRINTRLHALLSSMENPHPEWVKRPHYVLSSSDPFSKSEVWVKIKIIRSGIYEIPYDLLRSLGVDPSLYPISTYKMIAMLDTFPTDVDSATVWGRDVAIWVDTAGRRILFWGEAASGYRIRDTILYYFRHPYTDTTYYFLGLGGEGGQRIRVVSYPSGDPVRPLSAYRHEQELVNLGKKARVWFGEEMVRLATDPDRSYDFTFRLEDLDEDRGALLLRSGLANGEFSESAYVVLSVNEYPCDSARMSPASYSLLSCRPVVVNGDNSLSFTLRVSEGSQAVYLDYYEIIYHSIGIYSNGRTFYVQANGRFSLTLRGNRPVFVWDVSDPYAPNIVESYTYTDGILLINDSTEGWARIYVSNFARRPFSLELYTPKGLRELKVDYVALGHSSFASVFTDFLNYRKNRIPRFSGRRWNYTSGSTVWVNLQDIYDEFGLGNPDPTAIRNFLYNMNLLSVGEKPLYVVLVGDGDYDYRNVSSYHFSEGVPPYYPRDMSLSVNNELLGAYDDYYVDFDGDSYGNVGIGRIPVRDASELREYLQKVKEYESFKHDGLWRFRVLLVADDEYGTSTCETMHTTDLLFRVAPEVPNWMIIRPFLLEKYPFEGPTKPSATADLKRLFQRGYLMVSFFIHGNPTVLAHEQLLTMSDLSDINTEGKEPFITVLSCKVGAFDRLDPPHVMGEEFMIRRNRSIAVLSSTALSYASSNAFYASAIYRYIDSYGHAPFGYLALQGKNQRYYVLLGDPATILALPDPVLPVVGMGKRASVELNALAPVLSDTLIRGDINWAIGGGKGWFAATDLPDLDTVSFTCSPSVYEFHTERPVVFVGEVDRDSVRFWIPLRGKLSDTTTDTVIQKSLLLWWNGWNARGGFYPILHVNPSLGTEKPRVKGYYAGDELHDGFRLPTTVRLTFKFYSNEGFDIRTTGKDASPPRILLDNRYSDVLQVKITGDTTAIASYLIDYSSDPGTHQVAVSINSARGIKGYSLWDLNFVENSLTVRDLLPYPNPYRGGPFYMTFKLSRDANVKMRLYTTTGRLIRSYDLGNHTAGFNSVRVDLPDLANGIYVVVFEANDETSTVRTFTRVLIMR
ncbi:MAG: T9SS type A sorting domain-containing protein [Thermotogae bacterium]|nr:T9SS type A sorting domain-containing protein [Thermotogota bacterium]